MTTSVVFTLYNGFKITSSVELSTVYNDLTQIVSIGGNYRNVEFYDSKNGLIFGNVDAFSTINIDGESPVQGTQAKVTAVLDKIKQGIIQNTGKIMLTGKNLTILTGQ